MLFRHFVAHGSTVLLTLSVIHIGHVNAFFRLFLDFLVIEPADPIVAFGDEPAAHVSRLLRWQDSGLMASFMFRYTSLLALVASAAKPISKGCEKANVQPVREQLKYQPMDLTLPLPAPTPSDKSAYWTPMLYFHHKTKGFKTVPIADITVYYKYETNEVFYPFKRGFQMRAGNAEATSPDPLGAINWKCLNPGSIENTPGMPKKPCLNGLRAEISFPNCWNGHVTKNGDESHMAYATDFMAGQDNGVQGTCPKSHPYKVPRLFYEVMFKISEEEMPRAEATNPQQPFVLSTGDATGYALHADFMNGWIPRFLSRVLKQCDGADGANAASGEPKTCFVDVRPEGANNCRKQGDSPDVIGHPKVAGVWLDKLPGKNPVTP